MMKPTTESIDRIRAATPKRKDDDYTTITLDKLIADLEDIRSEYPGSGAREVPVIRINGAQCDGLVMQVSQMDNNTACIITHTFP